MTDDELLRLRKLAEQATPDVLAALRSCIEQYVDAWYINADGSEAKPKPDSPVLAMVEAAGSLPALLDLVDSLTKERDEAVAEVAWRIDLATRTANERDDARREVARLERRIWPNGERG